MKKLIIFFIVLLEAIKISRPMCGQDIGWHVVIGRWILAHGFPTVDQWNMYSEGVFRAYSWFPEIIYAIIERYFGSLGLLSLELILFLSLGLTLVYIYTKMSKDLFMGTFLSLVTLSSFGEFATLRPQIISWFCFAISIYLANEVYENGWNKKRYLFTILTFIVLANSNITTSVSIFAFCLIGFNGLKKDTYKLLLIPLIGTLITPYIGHEWSTFFHKINHPFAFNDIMEFKPLMIMSLGGAAIIVLTFLFCSLWHYYDSVLSKSKLFCLFVITLLAFLVCKFLPYATILCTSMICLIWRVDKGQKYLNFSDGINKLKKLLSYFEGTGLAFLLLCICIVGVNSLIKKDRDRKFVYNLPNEAIKFIKENNLKSPILNSFDTGEALIYSFSNEKGEPSLKVPIDGRTNVTSPKVYKLFLKSFNGAEGWQDYINFVNPKTILWENHSPFVRLLTLDKENWCKVYADNYGAMTNDDKNSGFSVFIRRDSEDSEKLCLN